MARNPSYAELERNVVGQSFLRRYVLRGDLLAKIAAHYKQFVRLNTKDAFADQKALLPPSDKQIILDVGANIGAVSQRYSALFPQAEIFALEASPEIFPVLQNNFKGVRNVHTHNYAVSDRDGEVDFNVNFNSGTSSILDPSPYNRAAWASSGRHSQVRVPSISIPSFCAQNNIETIDILKLDIEGAELMALRGCVPMLARNRIKLIYTEACLTPLYQNQPLFHHLTLFLEEHGYALYNIYNVVESKIRQGTITNATYLSPDMREQLRAKWGTAYCGW